MDDENETLDWGNEEEENQESSRKHFLGAEQDGTAIDDVEDTISLGDDEDEQGFYPYRQNVVDSAYPTSTGNDRQVTDSYPSVSKEDSRTRHYDSGYEKDSERNSFGDSSVGLRSPKRRSTSKSSPPRSYTRMTHALPPKPAALEVPVLPPSHSSIIAATSMTSPISTSRDSKKLNGKAAADLPQDWETRISRKNEVYYYNRVTYECTWTRPVNTPTVVLEDSRSHWQQRSPSPTGSRQIPSKDPNANNSQTSRSNRDTSRNGRSDPGNEDGKRPKTPDLNLTYEDRHYRPGGDSFSTSKTIRAVARLEISPKTGRYARSPSPPRRRARSISLDTRGEPRAKVMDPTRDQRSGREKSAYTNPPPKLDSYVPGYERRRSPSPQLPSPAESAMRVDREQIERTSRRDQDSMSVDSPDYRSGRPPARKEEGNREHRGRSRNRNSPTRDLDPRQGAKQSNYISPQRSRSPQLRRERKREPQERERTRHEPTYSPDGLSRKSPPLLIQSAAVSDGRGREFDRQMERDRPGRYSPSRSGNGPSSSTSMQEMSSYTRSREFDKSSDMVAPRRDGVPERDRNQDRERPRVRERDSERSQLEPLPVSDHSKQRLPGPSRSKGDEPPRRPGEDQNSGDASILRPRRAPLPPQQASYRSARLKEPPPASSIPAVRADGNSAPLPPRQPRSQTYMAGPDVRHPRSEARQYSDTGPNRTQSSSDTKMDLDQDEVPRSGRRLSPAMDQNRSEFDSRNSFQTSPVSERKPDIPSQRPSGPAPVSRDNLRRVQNDDKRPEDRFENDVGDRVVKSAQPERSTSRRNKEPPSRPAARLTGTNNIPIGTRRNVPVPRPPDLAIPKQPASTLNSRLPPSESVPGRSPESSTLVNPPRDLPPGKECYERPPDLIISDPPRRAGRPSEKGRNRESRFSKKQDDRGKPSVPQSAPVQDRIRNNSVNPPTVPRDSSDTTPVPKAAAPRSTDGRPDGNSNGGDTITGPRSGQFPPNLRENYRPPGTTPEVQPIEGQRRNSTLLMNEQPLRKFSDDVDNPLSQRLGRHDAPPPRLFKSALPKTSQNDDFPNDLPVHGPSNVEGQSPFISRVEPPSRTGSLLDRLSIDDNRRGPSGDARLAPSPSLRDRLVPSKRGREEMLRGEGSSGRLDLNDRFYDPDEGSETKRARRRGGKGRRSGGGGGGGNGRRI